MERLGKQRSFTPVTARVPGVRVAAVKRIQINPREKIGVKLNRVPLAVPNQNKFNFNKPTVSVNKVISGSAPQINTMQRKTQVNIKKLLIISRSIPLSQRYEVTTVSVQLFGGKSKAFGVFTLGFS